MSNSYLSARYQTIYSTKDSLLLNFLLYLDYKIMVLLEKPPLLHFSTFDSIVGLQFHAHTLDLHSALSPDTCSRRIERFVAAAGTQIKIWAVSWPKTEESKNSPTALEIADSDAAIEHNIVEPVTSEDIASKSNPGLFLSSDIGVPGSTV